MLSKIILVLSILVLSFSLSAKPQVEELEAKSGDVTIRITSKPCTNKAVLEQLKPEFKPKFRQAEIRVSGKTTPACWVGSPEGIFILTETGDNGYIAPEQFKPVEVI